MNDSVAQILTFIAAICAGLVGGTFFAFSNFIMKALARLPVPNGIAAMRSINVTVITPLFMTALFGTGAASLFLAVIALRSWDQPGAFYLLAGSLLYVIGTVVVTIAFNVPRNEALAVSDPASDSGERVWTGYLRTWTAWNHVRTIAALLASACFIVAFAVRWNA